MTAHENRKSTLTVMTLNLWGANRWEDRRSAVVDWVNEVQPDLLALQEVVRAGGHCQASWIAAHTQMTALFGAASTTDGGEFGNEPPGGVWPSDHFAVAAKLLLPDR